MTDHSIVYDLRSPSIGTWKCNAPAEAACHALFDCDCEQVYNYRVINGVPAHDSSADPETETHAGRFDPDFCHLSVWYEESDEAVEGEVRVDVEPEWHLDSYTFTATAARMEES